MKRKLWMVVAIAALALATVAGAAYQRQGRGPGGLGGRGGNMGGFGFFGELRFAHMEARLNLSADQSQKIRDVLQSERTKLMQNGPAGKDERQALAAAIFADNPDQAEIQRRVQALKSQHERMLNEIVQTGLQVNQVLTPEQRAEMRQMIAEKDRMRNNMRQRFQQRRQQPTTPPSE